MVPINDGEKPGPRTENRDAPSPVEYYSTGVLSFLATALVLASVYHSVVALARPLHLLSTTVIAFVFLATWAAVWLALELVWGWRSGRISTA